VSGVVAVQNGVDPSINILVGACGGLSCSLMLRRSSGGRSPSDMGFSDRILEMASSDDAWLGV
jgi:hypothetical protein